MKKALMLVGLIISNTLLAQTLITGSVTDKKNVPIVGANVYLQNTYDGATTDADGKFSFKSDAANVQTLIVSYLSFTPCIIILC